MANPGIASSSIPNYTGITNGMQLLFILQGANMQLGVDQQFTRFFSGTTFDPMYITATWVSGAISGTCLGGIYPAPNRGGTGWVSSTQNYSGLAGINTHVNCLIQATTTTGTATPYLNLTTPNGGPLFADFRIYGFCYD